MAEQSIEVGYAPLGGGYFHKFIIYTDAGGNEWIARGGPTGDTPAQGFVSEVTQAQAGNADQWGNIRTEVEPYAYGAQDYVPRLGDPNYNANNLPHDRETIVRGGDLTEAWEKIQEEMTRINSAGYKYKPVTQNSNTVVDDALDYAGLPQPQDDNRGEHLAPGSGHRFPKRLGGRGGRIAGAAAPAFYKAEGTPY
jgi:hypothetical protein